MCGITGFWQTKALDDHPLEILGQMGAALAHRGPDDSGCFFESATGLGMAFRRLSIIDLSPEGHQPMTSASGRFVIIFNGEVYNFEEIRTELPGGRWRGHSDTEVILEAIERWGLEPALKRFVGMFAFALWDGQEKQLHLVRDRLGIKPLYYGQVGSNFVFASELKAIRRFPGFQARINRDVLALYMRFSYVPAPHCIYDGIRQLPPGHILSLRGPEGSPEVRAYWSAVEVARQGLHERIEASDQDVVQELEDKLAAAIRLRMIADVPLGAFLSGGIDSSTVVALMQKQSSRPVKTFSIGFYEDSHNEAVHARKIAAHLGTDHTELYVTPEEARSVIPLLPAMYDEPFADSSQIPTYVVSRLARGQVTVSLSGDGGDELFGGYTRYSRLEAIWNFVNRMPGPAARAAAGLIHMLSPRSIDWLFAILPRTPQELQPSPGRRLYRLADYLQLRNPISIYLNALSQWTDPEAVVLGSHEPATVAGFMAEQGWLTSVQELAMLTDAANYLPYDILAKVDRASMAVSLEARVPILDHRVVEFAWRLPLRFKIRNGKQKWILRQVLYRYVPPELVERPKMGFSVPIDRWLRGPLREWAEERLSPDRLRRDGFFAVEPIRKKWREHLSGHLNWDYALWTVLVFQDWLDAQPAAAGVLAQANPVAQKSGPV
ncbi:MAG TPA: asparagine synthase (glutamine-hydrolyzing) [Candidatus Angelobacter sp.]|nr:asparagine synthase (glutamine-hydrolyzing) [Candidatus Angelobacter sp.]